MRSRDMEQMMGNPQRLGLRHAILPIYGVRRKSALALWCCALLIGMLTVSPLAGCGGDDDESPRDTGSTDIGDVVEDTEPDDPGNQPPPPDDTPEDVEIDAPSETSDDADVSVVVPTETAFARIVDLRTESSTVDYVWLFDGDRAFNSGAAFVGMTRASARPAPSPGVHATVPAGEVRIRATSDESSRTSQPITLEPDSHNAIFVYNTASGDIGATRLDDPLTGAGARARVRAIHAAPSFGDLTFRINTSIISAPTALGERIDPPIDVDPGPVTIRVGGVEGAPVSLQYSASVPGGGGQTFVGLSQVGDDATQTQIVVIGPNNDVSTFDVDPQIRLLNLNPGFSPLDIYTESSSFATGIAFGTASDYTYAPPGTFDVSLRRSGVPPAAPVNSTLEAVELSAGSLTTIVAWGEIDQLEALIVDDREVTAGAGESYVLYHTAPTLGTVAVVEVSAAGAFETLSEMFEAGDIEGPFRWEAGSIHRIALEVGLLGTIDPAFDLPGLAAGEVAYAFLLDDLGDRTLAIFERDGTITTIDPISDAEVQFIHVSPLLNTSEPAGVDLYFAEFTDNPVAEGLDYLSATQYEPFAAQGFGLDMYPTTTTSGTPFHILPSAYQAGVRYVVALWGQTDTPKSLITHTIPSFIPIDANEVRLSISHAADGIAPISFGVGGTSLGDAIEGGESLVSDRAFGVAGLTMTLDVNSTGSADHTFDLSSLSGGQAYAIFAVNTASGVTLVAVAPDGSVQTFTP